MAGDRPDATLARVHCVFSWADSCARLIGLARTLDAAKAVAGREESGGVRWERRGDKVYGYVPGLVHPLYFVERWDVEGKGDGV